MRQSRKQAGQDRQCDIDILAIEVRRDTNRARKGVVEMREGNLVPSPDLVSNYGLVDVIKLVLVLIKSIYFTP